MLPMKWEQPNTVKSCISIISNIRGKGFLYETEREQTDGDTERERACVCECRSAPKITSVDIHKQRGIETHLLIIDRRHLWSISGDVWECLQMRFPTVDLISYLRYLDRRQFKKGWPFWHYYTRKLCPKKLCNIGDRVHVPKTF